MEFEGTVFKILPVTQGTSARGPWQRQDVVFDVPSGSFTDKLAVTFFNRPDDVARLKEGLTYKVSINLRSREYNGRWYTDITAWRVQDAQPATPEPPMPTDFPPMDTKEPAAYSAQPSAYTSSPSVSNEADDLPF